MRKLKTNSIDVLTKISMLPAEKIRLINDVQQLRTVTNNLWYQRLLRCIFYEIMYPEECAKYDCLVMDIALTLDNLHRPDEIFVASSMLYSKMYDAGVFEHVYSIPNAYFI